MYICINVLFPFGISIPKQLTPPLFIDLFIPSLASVRSCICVLGVFILPLFLRLGFWNYSYNVVFILYFSILRIDINYDTSLRYIIYYVILCQDNQTTVQLIQTYNFVLTDCITETTTGVLTDGTTETSTGCLTNAITETTTGVLTDAITETTTGVLTEGITETSNYS